MLAPVMGTALRITTARMMADRALLSIVTLLALVASTLLVLAPMASNALADAAVQRRVATAAPAAAGISVAGQVEVGDVAEVASNLGERSGIDVDVTWLARSSGTVFGGQAPEGAVTSLTAVSDLDSLVTWTAGGPPGLGEATLHVDAAASLDLAVGDIVTTSLAPDGLRLAGIFEPTDRRDRTWFDQPSVRDGVVPGVSFTTIGPVVVSAETLELIEPLTSAEVRLEPVATDLTTDDIDLLRAAPARVSVAADDDPRLANSRIDSGLEPLLVDIRSSMRGSTAVVIALLAMTTALCLPALTIASGLLGDARRVETALASARGVSRRQIVGAAGFEAVLVSGLVAALTFPTAMGVLWLVRQAGGGGELDVRPVIERSAVLVLVLGVALTVAALLFPLREEVDHTQARASRARDHAAPFLRRTKLDVALVVVAIVGLWRVSQEGIGSRADRGIDPAVIIGPTLALAGAALIALRAVTALAAVLDVIATKRTGLPASLVTRSMTRRPTNVGRAALLVLLAVAIGGFALIHRATWTASQSAQADAEIGGDLRAVVDQRSGRVPDRLLVPIVRQFDGVETVRLATVTSATLGTTDVDLVLISEIPPRAGTTTRPGVTLDGNSLTVMVDSQRVGVEVGDGQLALSLTVLDIDGLVYELPAIRADSEGQRLVSFPLSESLPEAGPSVPYRGPLSLLGFRVTTPAGLQAATPDTEDLISAMDVTLTDWQLDGEPLAVPIVGSSVDADLRQFDGTGEVIVDAIDGGHHLTLRPPSARSLNATTEFRFDTAVVPDTRVPITISESLESEGLAVGDTIDLQFDRARIPVVISATDSTIPLLPRSDRAVMGDLGLVSLAASALGESPPNPTDLVLNVSQDDAGAVGDRMSGPTLRSPAVIDRWTRAQILRDDPGQIGIVVALSIALIGAAAAALIGLIANAINDRRERANEVAILRALGAPAGMLRRILTTEAVIVLGVSLALGLAIASTMAHLMLASLAVAVDGSTVVPEPTVEIPWTDLGILVIVVITATIVVPQVAFRSLRRVDTATALRAGEGRG